MQNIIVDIAHKGVMPPIIVTEGDAMSRFFQITLMDDGVPYELPDNPFYSVRYEAGANKGWYDTITEPDESTHPAVSVSDNVFTVEIAEAATLNNGILGLMISGDGGYQLTVTGFAIRSDHLPAEDAPETQTYYNAFMTYAERAEAAAEIAVEYGMRVEVSGTKLVFGLTEG